MSGAAEAKWWDDYGPVPALKGQAGDELDEAFLLNAEAFRRSPAGQRGAARRRTKVYGGGHQ